MTLGRAKGIDILAAEPNTGRMIKIEVKISTKPAMTWLMSEKHEHLDDPDLFFCFVKITADGKFRFFVVPSAVVRDYIVASHKHWADEKASRKREQPMRVFRVASAGEKYPVPTPPVDQYEDNWTFG